MAGKEREDLNRFFDLMAEWNAVLGKTFYYGESREVRADLPPPEL